VRVRASELVQWVSRGERRKKKRKKKRKKFGKNLVVFGVGDASVPPP
jgi:hypothetical protein